MKFKPLGKRVLVKLNETKNQTSGGIFIPETAQGSEFATGVVISVGLDVVNIKAMDNIMFSSSMGVDIEVEGEKLRLIPDESFVDAII
jgi:chaperonin GroES